MPRRILVKQFQELDANMPEEVHNIWNTVHLICLVIAAVFGWIMAYCFGVCMLQFDYNCFLFAKIYFNPDENTKNQTIKADIFSWNALISKTPAGEVDYNFAKWGNTNVCNFVQFLHICSMLSAIMWFVFLVLPQMSRRKSHTQIFEQPHRLMLPLLVWSIIAVVVIIGANSTLFSGLDAFCFILKLGKKNATKSFCLSLDKKPYDIFFGVKGKKIYQNLAVAKGSAVIGGLSWGVNVAWTLLRMYLLIDYKVYLVRIWRYLPDVPKKDKRYTVVDSAVKLHSQE